MTVIAVKRNHTYGHVVTLVVWECPSCGIVYGIPQDFANALRKQGPSANYYCPNGHHLSWHESEADLLRKKVTWWRDRYTDADLDREAVRRSLAATKGHLTRMRNRITNGVCPVPGCKRSGFTKVMAHIASVHPAWLTEHSHELEEP